MARLQSSIKMCSTLALAMACCLVVMAGTLRAENRLMEFCDSKSGTELAAQYDDVDAAYKAYLDTLSDNEKLENLVLAGYESFQKEASGKSRAKKKSILKHADRICSMREALAEAIEEAKQRQLVD